MCLNGSREVGTSVVRSLLSVEHPVKLTTVLRFPTEFPKATTGVFLPEQGLLFSGHENGLVTKWQIGSQNPEILHDCSSRVESMACLSGKKIVVGCHSGLVIVFSTSDPKHKEIVQEAGHNVYSRVWRVGFPAEDTIVTTSTYGVMNVLRKNGAAWESARLPGHGDSVFGLATFDGKLLVSGDFSGKIFVWQKGVNQYERSDYLKVSSSAIEGVAWRRDGAFAAIDYSGHIYFFEPDAEGKSWRSVFEADTARSRGTCIHITEDGKTVFAGSNTEVIQFDLESQQIQLIEEHSIRAIFSARNSIFLLTANGLLSFERSEVAVPANLVKYRYAKVSLIGRSGAGKSTLCSFIVKGSTGGIKSTFGRRIWDWTITDGNPQKKVIFSDVGGQESVLATVLTFLADSDIVLIFFKQTDKTTFKEALRLLDEIPTVTTRRTKIFFVQTFIDDEMNDVELEEPNIAKLIASGRILDRLEICPPSGAGIQGFKERIEREISWQDARTMIQSEYVEGLTRTISELQTKDVKLIDLQDLKKEIESVSGIRVSTSHLSFLLRNLSTQGLVEYYPEVLDAVILNDEEYNRLRTQVPRLVDYQKGIISIFDLEKKFGRKDYVKILDRVYVRYGVCIENGELRIFPAFLRLDSITPAEPYKRLLAKPVYEVEREFGLQKIEIARLLKALSELSLRCIDASLDEGVFAWDTNACVHYKFQESGDLKERRIKFNYVIGGDKAATCSRLLNEFGSLIERLFGPALAPSPSHVKKNDLEPKEFDAALSFAGEQRDYVKKVYDILAGKGRKVFYDEIYQSQMWGKDLAVYLQEVYYSKARYCIMFVSKEYVTKMYPSHELASALARQIEDPGYILPVMFDDVQVPGLNFTIARENANKKSPEQIADLFLERLEEEETC